MMKSFLKAVPNRFTCQPIGYKKLISQSLISKKNPKYLKKHFGFFNYTIICFACQLPLRNREKAVECKLHFD